MTSARRVSAVTFFKNNPFAVSSALNVLRTLAAAPSADNRRLAVLTGLGVTKSEADGVLPSYLGYLQAMNLVEPTTQAGLRYIVTPVGHAILQFDPHGGTPVTTALMALLLTEPYRGAHLFDWAVRGILWKLRPFRLEEFRQEINLLAAA